MKADLIYRCYSVIQWPIFDTSAKAPAIWVRQSWRDLVVIHPVIQVGRDLRRLWSPTFCSTQGQLRHHSRLLRVLCSLQFYLIVTPSSLVAIVLAYKHAVVNTTEMYIGQGQMNLQEENTLIKAWNLRHFFLRQLVLSFFFFCNSEKLCVAPWRGQALFNDKKKKRGGGGRGRQYLAWMC